MNVKKNYNLIQQQEDEMCGWPKCLVIITLGVNTLLWLARTACEVWERLSMMERTSDIFLCADWRLSSSTPATDPAFLKCFGFVRHQAFVQADYSVGNGHHKLTGDLQHGAT